MEATRCVSAPVFVLPGVHYEREHFPFVGSRPQDNPSGHLRTGSDGTYGSSGIQGEDKKPLCTFTFMGFTNLMLLLFNFVIKVRNNSAHRRPCWWTLQTHLALDRARQDLRGGILLPHVRLVMINTYRPPTAREQREGAAGPQARPVRRFNLDPLPPRALGP